MKRILITLAAILIAAVTYAQVDSSYFEQIDGKWYAVDIDYDADGTLLSRDVKIVGQTGDSSEVVTISRNGPINFASSWGASAAQAVNGRPQLNELTRTYGGLWETLTGGNYVTEKSSVLGPQFLFDQDSVKVRLFIFGSSYADFWLFQLPNERMRLQGIDNPATTEVDESAIVTTIVPFGTNCFMVINIPASDDAKTAKKLEEMKATNAGITTEIDQLITELQSTLNSNELLVFSEERIVQTQDGQTRQLPVFRSVDGDVAAVFITD